MLSEKGQPKNKKGYIMCASIIGYYGKGKIKGIEIILVAARSWGQGKRIEDKRAQWSFLW